jgi:hypothetical protein
MRHLGFNGPLWGVGWGGEGGNICGAWLSKVGLKQRKGRIFLRGQERASDV